MNTKNIPKAYISYTLLSFAYGILLWMQSLFLVNMKNNNYANNLIGLNLNISRSQIKGLVLSFVISLVYTIKDFYEFSSK